MLVEPGEAVLEVEVQGVELLEHPARPHTQQHAALAAQRAQRADLLGQGHRVAVGGDEHPGAEADARRGTGDHRQRGDGVVVGHVGPVVVRRPAGVGGAGVEVHGVEEVVEDPDRVEAELLGPPGHRHEVGHRREGTGVGQVDPEAHAGEANAPDRGAAPVTTTRSCG